MRGQKALFAQYESAMIRRRLDAGKALKRRAGRHAEGVVPYGYRRVTRAEADMPADVGQLEPAEPAAAIVRRIFSEEHREWRGG